jgi:hypothetical protein
MIDPFTLLTAAGTLLGITSTMFYSVKTILASHARLGEKIDDLVKVVLTHQVAIDTIVKDVTIFKQAAANK